jgi:RNA binding exosome subunit
VSVHNVTWSTTSSAFGAQELIERALEWMTGGYAEVFHEKVKSYHGAKMTLIHARIMKKKAAKMSLAHLGSEFLQKLADSDDLESKIDDDKVLHLRLSLDSLISGSIELSLCQEEQVKGRIKIEVYPGQEPVENARSILSKAAEIARVEELPCQLEIE